MCSANRTKDPQMVKSVGMPFKTHIYLDVREEGVKFSVVDNMLIKPGHELELPPPGEVMPGASLTPDDYDRGVNIRFWQNLQIDLVLSLNADQALDFLRDFISAFLAAHIRVIGPRAPFDGEELLAIVEIDGVTERMADLIQEAAGLLAGYGALSRKGNI